MMGPTPTANWVKDTYKILILSCREFNSTFNKLCFNFLSATIETKYELKDKQSQIFLKIPIISPNSIVLMIWLSDCENEKFISKREIQRVAVIVILDVIGQK